MHSSKIITVFLAIIISTTGETFSQRNPKLLNADTLINQGIQLFDQGKVDEAIEKYKLVNPADSNYFWAQYELGYSYLKKLDYSNAIEISKKAIQDGSTVALQYNILGTALDEIGQSEEALKVYDTGIARYPYNPALYFNKAVVYQIKGDLGKAKDIYLQLLDFSPYHASTHLRIARMCKDDGWLAQAMMAYTMFLILEPSSDRTFEVLSEFNKLCDGSLSDVGSAKQKTFKQEFEEIDELIYNQVALNKNYSVPSEFTVPVIRQIYLLIEQLKKDKDSGKGFFASFYVPFFKHLEVEKNYETFALLVLASSPNESISRQVNKQIDRIRSLRDEYLLEWRDLHSSYTIEENGKTTETTKWFSQDLNLQALGRENEKGENVGKWQFINIYGQIECLGGFNNGLREGVWTFFDTSGDTSKVMTFSNDKLNGKYCIYDKGLLNEKGSYNQGLVEGVVEAFYPDGTLAGITNFSKGEKNGPFEQYYSSGGPKLHLDYSNNQRTGIFKAYHENSALSDSSAYVADNLSGIYKKFYEDGKIERELFYVDGVIEGDYKTYYRNGQVESEGLAKNGSVSGQWTSYYSNGKVSEKSTYDERGKITGDVESFDPKGKRYKLASYFKGDLIKVTYFNKDGEAIYSYDADKDDTLLCDYDYNRFKRAEGCYKDLKKEGIWNHYSVAGTLETVENYKNDKLDGDLTNYHKNGKIKEQYYLVDGSINGPCKSFFPNGVLESEGNYKDGARWGAWYEYFSNGKIYNESYYQNDVMVGKSNYYVGTGKLDLTLIFNTDGILVGKYICDTNGLVIDSTLFKTGSLTYELNGKSGEKFVAETYKNGYLQGLQQIYFPNGKLSSQGMFYAGSKTGEWVKYFPNSNISNRGNYFHGEQTGKWESFDYFGNLTIVTNFVNGEEHGLKHWYYPDGKIEIESEIYEDERNNKTVYYADNGDIREIRYYDYGLYLGYSYLNNKMEAVDTIFLKNGDGHVKAYYSNGKVSTEYTLNNGEYDGVYKIYYPDGNLQEERMYEFGINVAPITKYYNNGNIFTKSNYIDGQLNGETVEYNPNGTLRLREHYLNDELHGIAEYFNTEGERVNAYQYYCGYMVGVIQ